MSVVAAFLGTVEGVQVLHLGLFDVLLAAFFRLVVYEFVSLVQKLPRSLSVCSQPMVPTLGLLLPLFDDRVDEFVSLLWPPDEFVSLL